MPRSWLWPIADLLSVTVLLQPAVISLDNWRRRGFERERGSSKTPMGPKHLNRYLYARPGPGT